ncbi:MAG: ClC family H(+)/Cl(-) exchange transporter [Selenomonadaceae bacterium]|nr:ClC family H(+)/Cl(-) exchange transporter [Selenomonadaceae bacterium]
MKFFRLQLFIEGLIVGIATGFLIALLRFILDEADIIRPEILQTSNPILILIYLILVAIILAKFISIDSQIAGSGIPQLKGVLQNRMRVTHWFRLLILKFIATILAIASGFSLGRAGLSVQFGSCVGIGFERLKDQFKDRQISRRKYNERFLLIAGAAAGLASIFSAPLAGMIFCIEELQKKSSAEVLTVTLASTVSSVWIVDVLFGARPVFNVNQISSFDLGIDYLYLIALGIFCGILGMGFTKCLILSLDFYDKHVKLTSATRFIPAAILILPIGIFLPEILGCGNVLVSEMLSKNFAIELLAILFIGKFLFTMICFGSNAPGGIFLPLLVLGAIAGSIFAKLIDENFLVMFTVFGMAGYFASVVKAPITGSILIMEITGTFDCLMNVLCVSMIAFLISDLAGGIPAYDALLNRSLRKSRNFSDKKSV